MEDNLVYGTYVFIFWFLYLMSSIKAQENIFIVFYKQLLMGREFEELWYSYIILIWATFYMSSGKIRRYFKYERK